MTEHVLVNHVAFGLVKFRGVCSRQFVQNSFDCVPNRCPCRLSLLPVEHELFTLELLQEFFGDLLHFPLFGLAQDNIWLGQQVEDGQFFLG